MKWNSTGCLNTNDLTLVSPIIIMTSGEMNTNTSYPEMAILNSGKKKITSANCVPSCHQVNPHNKSAKNPLFITMSNKTFHQTKKVNLAFFNFQVFLLSFS